MNVLIVDDEPLARERLIRMVGELEGYRVLEPSASNGVMPAQDLNDEDVAAVINYINVPTAFAQAISMSMVPAISAGMARGDRDAVRAAMHHHLQACEHRLRHAEEPVLDPWSAFSVKPGKKVAHAI